MPSSKTTRITAIAAIGGMLLLILGGVVVQVLGMGAGSDDDADTAGASQAEPAPAAGECNEAPALPPSPPTFSEVPDKALAQRARWKATVSTNCGDVVLELYGDEAPQTVASFIFLAEEDYWADSPCHRLVTQGIFVLQCGDPTGTGSGGPGYGYGVENGPPDGSYPRGTLAMARTADPNTNGGQMFVVFDDTQLPTDGGGYSIFGKVVGGMDIVDRIAASGVGGTLGPEAPAEPISILDVTVEKMS